MRIVCNDVRVGRACEREGCSGHGQVDRHHKRMETLFINAFASTSCSHGRRYKQFVRRYDRFLPEDTVLLCRRCHEEIHNLYYDLIRVDIVARGKHLAAYSWREADALMNKLASACDTFLTCDTSLGVASRN